MGKGLEVYPKFAFWTWLVVLNNNMVAQQIIPVRTKVDFSVAAKIALELLGKPARTTG